MVLVKDVMHKAISVDGGKKITDIAKIMRKKGIGSVLILQDDKIKGIVTLRDIMKRVVCEGRDPSKVTGNEIATYKLITISQDEDIIKASTLCQSKGLRRLPVTKDGTIIGFVSTRDLAKTMLFHYSRRIRGESEVYRG